jgi:hypothetical protein
MNRIAMDSISDHDPEQELSPLQLEACRRAAELALEAAAERLLVPLDE